jgi:hypothetical protein
VSDFDEAAKALLGVAADVGAIAAERDSLRAQVEALRKDGSERLDEAWREAKAWREKAESLTKERDDARVEAEHWKTVAGREAYLKAALDRSTAERAALRAALEKVVEEDAEEKSMGLYDAVHAALSLDTSPGVRFLVAARRFFDSVGGFRGESAEFEIALNARRAELIE